MRSSNEALVHIEGGCAHDDGYAYTPSGVRTKVALKPEGIVVPLFSPLAQQALDELAAADEAREEEEPTAEWTPSRRTLDAWDDTQLQALVSMEVEQEQSQARAPQPAEPQIEIAQDELALDTWSTDELDALEESWMWSDDAVTPAEYVSPWRADGDRSQERAVMPPCPPDWTRSTWLSVGAMVLAGELAVIVFNFI